MIVRQGAERIEVGVGEQAVVFERLDVDQVRITGEGRKALVGRIAVTGGPERANLPVAKTSGLEKCQPRIDGAVKGTNTVGARQCSRVQEYTGGALSQPIEQRGDGVFFSRLGLGGGGGAHGFKRVVECRGFAESK